MISHFTRQLPRQLISLVAWCCLGMFLFACPPVSAGEFIISYWCGPPAEKGNYDAQYAEVAECNFTHACFPCTGASVEQNKAILDACQKHGLKFIPSDGRLLEKQPSDPMFAAN